MITETGNVTKQPELLYTQTGKSVVKFSIAVTSKSGDTEYTTFLDVEAWGTLAENIADSVTKGMRVIVTGWMKQDSWEDPEGNKRTKLKINAQTVGPCLRWASATVTKNGKGAAIGALPKQTPAQQEEERAAARYEHASYSSGKEPF